MRIGILSPFNPASIAEFLDSKKVPSFFESATAVNTLVREFIIQGHHVDVFTLSPLIPNQYCTYKGVNVSVHLIPMGLFHSFLGYHQFSIGQLFLPKRIAKVIETISSNLDVLHAHWTYEYAKAASFFSNRIPVFVTVRDWCPYQITIQKGLKNKIEWRIKYRTFRQVMSDKKICFIANSSYTHKMLSQSYPEKHIPIIPNPIKKDWIISKKEGVPESYQFISIASGLLSPRKNIQRLLEAFADYRNSFPNSHLHLVGGYNENDALFQGWKRNGLLEGVIFYGFMKHNKLSALLDKMTCLIHPALEETFGNILIEAMSRCIPCIGGDKAGAVPEVLGNGKYGILCDITDSHSIFKAMIKINDSSTILQITREATKMLLTKYSSDIVVSKHIDLFKKYARNHSC